MDKNTAGVSLLVVTSTIGVFTGLLPELSDVRKSTLSDPESVNDVRMGEIAASALVVGIGVAASAVSGDKAPLIVSVCSAAVLVAIYESVLRATPKEKRST